MLISSKLTYGRRLYKGHVIFRSYTLFPKYNDQLKKWLFKGWNGGYRCRFFPPYREVVNDLRRKRMVIQWIMLRRPSYHDMGETSAVRLRSTSISILVAVTLNWVTLGFRGRCGSTRDMPLSWGPWTGVSYSSRERKNTRTGPNRTEHWASIVSIPLVYLATVQPRSNDKSCKVLLDQSWLVWLLVKVLKKRHRESLIGDSDESFSPLTREFTSFARRVISSDEQIGHIPVSVLGRLKGVGGLPQFRVRGRFRVREGRVASVRVRG